MNKIVLKKKRRAVFYTVKKVDHSRKRLKKKKYDHLYDKEGETFQMISVPSWF